MDMRDRFITAIYQKALQDRGIVFLSCDYGAPSLDRLRAELPDRFINVAISEQNAVSVAAGLAKEGQKVILYSIASFITLRCLEQVKLDLCAMKLPVTIAAVGPGYAYGVDGPSHHATEDLALMRAMAGMTIYSPSDEITVDLAVEKALESKGPVYCRLDRGKFPRLARPSATEVENGFRLLGSPAGIGLATTGAMVHQGLDAAVQLKNRGVDLGVMDIFRIKPLAGRALARTLAQFDLIFTLEEHTVNGGLGSLVAEVVGDQGLKTRVRRLAVDDDYLYGYGQRETLRKKARIDTACLVAEVLEAAAQRLSAA